MKTNRGIQRLTDMRTFLISIVFVLLIPILAFAGSAEDLAQAKQNFSAGDPVGGEQLLQQVVESSDASAVEVEEALFWQLMLYSGDFLSSVALMQSMGAVDSGSGLKRLVAQQMGLSRWAFFVASGNYLNNTVTGGSLEKVTLEMPKMDSEDTQMLLSTLANPELIATILADYETDQSVGLGLLERTNQYSMYLALADGLPGMHSHDFALLRGRVSAGESFDQLHFLDWVARVALDMDSLLNETNGPDLPSIQQRCDQRITALLQGDRNNKYLREVEARSKRVSE